MVPRLVLGLKYLLETKNGPIYQGTFLDWNSVPFCLAIGITDNTSLFFPHWNATMLKVMTRIKGCHRPCLYNSNCSATFRCAMIYEIVFKLNLGPNGSLTRNPNNLIAVEQSGMPPSDNTSLKICSLNARSLRNKSAAFVELVNDLNLLLCPMNRWSFWATLTYMLTCLRTWMPYSLEISWIQWACNNM